MSVPDEEKRLRDRARSKAYAARYPEKIKARNKIYNSRKTAEQRRAAMLWTNHRMRPLDYEVMWESQGASREGRTERRKLRT